MKYDRYTKIELKENKQYIFDKLIFSISILILLCIFLFIVFINGGLNTEKHYYVSCKTDYGNQNCYNPMYLNYPTCNTVWENACNEQLIANGFTYGSPPPRYFLYFNYCVFMILVLAFTINHIIHNRHLKLKEIEGKE